MLIDDSEYIDSSEESSTIPDSVLRPRSYCNNCKRKFSSQNNTCYSIIPHIHTTKDIIGRYNFKFVMGTKVEPECNEEVYLCHECSNYLTTRSKEANKACNIWPSYVWYLIQSTEI